jgi:hypothetical protein
MNKIIIVVLCAITCIATSCGSKSEPVAEQSVQQQDTLLTKKDILPKPGSIVETSAGTGIVLADTTSERILTKVREQYQKISELGPKKSWRNGGAVGVPGDSGLVTINGKHYEYFIEIPTALSNETLLWFRIVKSKSQDGFPRQRLIFVYNNTTKMGSIVNQIYSKEGQPESITDEMFTLKDFEVALSMLNKIAGI